MRLISSRDKNKCKNLQELQTCLKLVLNALEFNSEPADDLESVIDDLNRYLVDLILVLNSTALQNEMLKQDVFNKNILLDMNKKRLSDAIDIMEKFIDVPRDLIFYDTIDNILQHNKIKCVWNAQKSKYEITIDDKDAFNDIIQFGIEHYNSQQIDLSFFEN